MSFEEDFPSLKGKKTSTVPDCYYRGSEDDDAILIEDIVECCLDKQRVREAIRKQHNKLEREAQGDNSWLSGLSYLEDLEEELGL